MCGREREFSTVVNNFREHSKRNKAQPSLDVPGSLPQKVYVKLCKKKRFVFICKAESGAGLGWLWGVWFHLHECTEGVGKLGEDNSEYEAELLPGSCRGVPNYCDNPKHEPTYFQNAS